MGKNDKIFIAVHEGMIGSAIMRRLGDAGFNGLITRTTGELDLTDQKSVLDFFISEKPYFAILP